MKNFRFSHKGLMSATALLLCSISISAAFGQPQGGRGGQGGGGGMGRGFQGRGGGQRGIGASGINAQNAQMPNGQNQNGQMPGVMGIITNGDASIGQILIQSPQGNATMIVQVTSSTQIVTQVPVTAANLQANDTVIMGGMGGGGQMPPPPMNGSNSGTGTTNAQRPMRGQGGSNQGSMTAGAQGGGRFGGGGGRGGGMMGQVTSTSPLTVTDSSGNATTLNLSSTARVMKLTTISFSNLQVGDRVRAMGQMDSSGVFVATRIMVNTDMGQGGGSGTGQGTQQNTTSRSVQGQSRMANPGGMMPQGGRGRGRGGN